jgi:hypothetical protein
MSSLTIVTSHWKEELGWLKESPFPVVVIDKEGSAPSCFEPTWIIPNKGCEITVYFKYIIENYDTLPDHVAFIHGHETQYHQRHVQHFLDVIKHSNRAKYGYIPLNNEFRVMYYRDYDPEPDPNIIPIKFSTWWKKFKIPFQKPEDSQLFVVDKSPQFIASRDKLRSVPKEIYQHWYDTLMDANPGREMGGYIIFFENIFSWLYGRDEGYARIEWTPRGAAVSISPDLFFFEFKPEVWNPNAYMAPAVW